MVSARSQSIALFIQYELNLFDRQFLLNATPRPGNDAKPKAGYREQQFSRSDPDENLEPHPDERQVGLDTDRSFVVYPVGDSILLHVWSDT